MNYSSPLLRVKGAAQYQDEAQGLDAAGVAWHYGDPLGEQRPIQTGGAVVVDRSHRAVLHVTGKDAATFLNTILSQKLDDVSDGYSAQALDLDIQGRILHHTDVTKVGDAYYLDHPSMQAATFVDFLRKMVFWSEVEITEPDLGVLTILGEYEIPAEVTSSAAFVRRHDWRGTPRQDLAVPRDQLKETVDKLGLPLAGLMAFTAERVRAQEPELAVDLDEKSIPHEIPNLIGRGDRAGAVHLEKGCYRGQETVARVENLGRSPRLLVLMHLDGSAPQDPVPGDDIQAGGRRVGRLGTVVHDCDYGPIALGLVKRSALDSGELTIMPSEESGRAQVSATIDTDSVPVEEGEKAGREAIKRLKTGEF